MVVGERNEKNVRKNTKVALRKRPMGVKAAKAEKRTKLDNYDKKGES